MRASVFTKVLLLLGVTAIVISAEDAPPLDNVDIQESVSEIARDANQLDVTLRPELSGNIWFQIAYRVTMGIVALLRLYLDVLNNLVEKMDALPSCTKPFQLFYRHYFKGISCKSEEYAFSHLGKFWKVAFSGYTDDFNCVGESNWEEIEKALKIVFDNNDDLMKTGYTCIKLGYNDEWEVTVKMQLSSNKTYDSAWEVPCKTAEFTYTYTEDESEWKPVSLLL